MYFRAGREGSWIKDREPESPAHTMSVLREHAHSLLVESGAVGGTTPLCALLVRSRQHNKTPRSGKLSSQSSFPPGPPSPFDSSFQSKFHLTS